MMVVLVFDEYVLYCNHYWGEAGREGKYVLDMCRYRLCSPKQIVQNV